MLRGVQGPQNIRLNLDQYLSSVWSAGHIAVGKLWEYYCQYPYLPRLADRSVLDNGILKIFDELTWETQGFAVATGYNEATGKYEGLALPMENMPPSISDSTLLVHPSRAIAQREAEKAEAEVARAEAAAKAAAATGGPTTATDGGAGTGTGPGLGTSSANGGDVAVPGGGTIPGPLAGQGGAAAAGGASAPPVPKNTRFYGTFRLDPERYGKDITKVAQEVIQHLAAQEGVDLDITVEITAVKKDGFPDTTVRIVSENARTLKFEDSGFEDR